MNQLIRPLLLCFILSACSGDNKNDSDPNSNLAGGDTQQDSGTFVLEPIGNRDVVFNQTLQIDLIASVVENASVAFSSDGSVGPDADPYAVADNPAVFDAVQGRFSWTPGPSHAGQYSVRFVATTDEAEPRSAAETISITVWSEGRKLFEENCATCHGIDASGAAGSNNRNIQGESADTIEAAINGNVSAMSAFKGVFTRQQIEAIAAHLATLVP